jgi:hypothetical protein
MKAILDYKSKQIGSSPNKNNVSLSCIIENDTIVSFSVFFYDFEVCRYDVDGSYTLHYCFNMAFKVFQAF